MQQWEKKLCELCSQELNGAKQWEEHVQTRKHKNKVHQKYKLDNPSSGVPKKDSKKEEEEKKEDDDIDCTTAVLDMFDLE